MANPEHMKMLKRGVDVWNKWMEENQEIFPDITYSSFQTTNLSNINFSWVDLREAKFQRANLKGTKFIGAKLNRANLTGANLSNANLSKVDSSEANFSEANLCDAKLSGANLTWAELGRANLRKTNLNDANLTNTNLSDTDLSNADLTGAKLFHTKLDEAELNSAIFGNTIFALIDLKNVKNLISCTHFGPSIIDFQTIQKSWPLPLEFLRGCGLSDLEIEVCKLYNKDLNDSEITDITYKIHNLRAGTEALQYYSCFISYSHKNDKLANRIYSDLQDEGIRCWFAPENIKIGDRIRSRIDEAIRFHDKLLLILSEDSIESKWVEKEVETAFEKEREEKQTVLFPIRLDESVMETKQAWAADIRRTRHIGDFRQWKDHDKYQKSFDRLLRDLKTGKEQQNLFMK